RVRHYHFSFFFHSAAALRDLHSFPTRRSSDLPHLGGVACSHVTALSHGISPSPLPCSPRRAATARGPVRPSRSIPSRPSPTSRRSEEHTSELQSRSDLVCRLLLEKKKTKIKQH